MSIESLLKQFELAEKDISEWPNWMKKEEYYTKDNDIDKKNNNETIDKKNDNYSEGTNEREKVKALTKQ